MTVLERFWPKVEKTEGCWIWKGADNAKGYGRVVAAGRTRPAHVIAYELLVGPVPAGLELDHLCRNRGCVNPAHLEAVTHRVNTLRGDTITAARARQTHCVRGHELTEANTYERERLQTGHRQCITCQRQKSAQARMDPAFREKQRAYDRERYLRRKAAAA